jgi:beta-galactosidase
VDAQGRFVPVAQNKINFSIEGPGKMIGVGNGDPSCHEPDTYVSTLPIRSLPVNEWRWKLAKIPGNSSALPEYANDFDDSAWTALKAKPGDNESTIKTPNTTAIYRAHVTLTEEDLKDDNVQIRFGGCDDDGWYFVNGQFIGESHDWQAQPSFDAKKFLRAGDNVIAVAALNTYAEGGLNPNVNVDIIGKPSVPPWSRSLFNGLAQVIVQSKRDAGEIKLTATAEGLKPATVVVPTQPSAPRPSAP